MTVSERERERGGKLYIEVSGWHFHIIQFWCLTFLPFFSVMPPSSLPEGSAEVAREYDLYSSYEFSEDRSQPLPPTSQPPPPLLPEAESGYKRFNVFYDESLVPLSERERNYYRDYDPMVGYRIALSLGLLILLFTIFILYKTHCRAKKNRKLIMNAANQVNNPLASGTFN